MKNADTHIVQDTHDAGASDASGNGSATPYTPAQRQAIREGLRILARVAIRAHLQRQAADRIAVTDDGESDV